MDVHFVRQWRVAKKSLLKGSRTKDFTTVRWEEGSQRMTKVHDGKKDDSEDVWEGG